MRKLIIKRLNERETYADVIVQILREPANGQGATIEEMESTVPIIEKLQKIEMPEVGNVEMNLEDAEWATVKDRVLSAGYTKNDRAALDMVHDIVGAEEFDASALLDEKVAEG